VLIIPENSLTAENKFIFNIQLTSGTKTIQKSFFLDGVSSKTPGAAIVQDFDVVNPNVKVELSVVISTEFSVSEIDILWSEASEKPVIYVTPLNQATIVLASNTLIQGYEYTFEVEVTDPNGSAISSLSFVVNNVPTDGTISVTPDLGTALVTKFEISAENWTDLDNNFPLLYKYYQLQNGIVNAIS
jgi:hypothetical protein